MFERITSLLVGFSAHLLGAFKVACASIVARVMSAMGLSMVSFKYVLPEVKAYILQSSAGMDSAAMQIAGALGVDVFMTLILSALVAKVGLKVVLATVDSLAGMISDAGG